MSTQTWSQRDISVASVVEVGSYAQLGVPHFQRGLVWGDEAVGLLLESLFHETPCGTFILWKPLKPASHGVALVTRPGNHLAYLIIDGQQRIRSLHGVFGAGRSEGSDTIWCVNLVQVPGLEEVVDPDLDGYPLFMKVRPPDADKARFRHNIVPLAALLSANEREVDWERYIPQPRRREVLDGIAAVKLPERCQAMRERRMFLVVKEEGDQNNGLSTMVRLYNRINSSGKRVEAEERAFATLTAIRPDTGGWVSDMFRAIHPGADGNEPTEEVDRDQVLARKKERSFGFKLFIRALVQVCSYHLDYSVGSSGFSFDVVARADFQQKLSDKWNKPDVDAIWDTTGKCILKVRSVLAALGCDDLRMLPDTECLLPLFQVLIRYPAVLGDTRYDRPLQAIALRMVLCEMSPRERLVLVRRVNESDSLAGCMTSLAKDAAVKVWLEGRLGASDSLQDRYVLLLYWLLRRRDACDFSASSIKDTGARAELEEHWAAHGLALREVMEPEKQHMVPYSRLKGVYDLGGRTRLSAHVVNNIGNVTYISSALNGLNGLADEPVVLAHDPVKNLRAHFLLEEEQTKSESALGQLYAGALDGNRKDFERFCKARCKLMAEAFEAWLSELDTARVPQPDVAPADRLLASRWPGAVRKLGFSQALEDRLLRLIRDGADPSDSRGELVLDLKDVGGGKLRASRDEVTADRLALERHRELRREVERGLPDTTERPDGSFTFSKPMNTERERAILKAMDEMVAVVRSESASSAEHVGEA